MKARPRKKAYKKKKVRAKAEYRDRKRNVGIIAVGKKD